MGIIELCLKNLIKSQSISNKTIKSLDLVIFFWGKPQNYSPFEPDKEGDIYLNSVFSGLHKI